MNGSLIIPSNVVEYYRGRSLPRGIRNNNPGNIRLGSNWQGLCAIQQDQEFCQFNEAVYGLRALAYLMRAYFDRYHLTTAAQIINRWAPTSENNTSAYVGAVAKSMRVGPVEELDLHNDDVLGDLMQAIIKHENGAQPYSGLQLMAGIRLLQG